jgi:hypothetical protein
MSTASTPKPSPSTEAATSFVADTVKQTSSQVLGAISQTSKFTIDTVSAFVDSFSKVTPSLPSLPFAPSKASLKELLDVSFETTEQIVKLQHELLSEALDRLAIAAA